MGKRRWGRDLLVRIFPNAKKGDPTLRRARRGLEAVVEARVARARAENRSRPARRKLATNPKKIRRRMRRELAIR